MKGVISLHTLKLSLIASQLKVNPPGPPKLAGIILNDVNDANTTVPVKKNFVIGGTSLYQSEKEPVSPTPLAFAAMMRLYYLSY